MKGLKKTAILLSIGVLLIAFGCTPEQPKTENQDPMPEDPPAELPFTPHSSAEGIPSRLALEEEKIAVFSEGAPAGFYWADGYSNGNQFDCTWRRQSASIEDGAMRMTVSKEGSGYAGAEYRTENRTPYGFYAVCMKSASCSGIISSFFGYTSDPVWDEIDIEFLGKDPGVVQFNYYTAGKGGHEFVLDLGFDSSADFHEYAFDWQPNAITWYVDGTAVYRATAEPPSHPFQLMMNIWKCSAEDWSGPFDAARIPVSAEYRWFAYSPNE